MNSLPIAIGFDLGGSSLKCVAVDTDKNILKSERIPFKNHGVAKDWIDATRNWIHQIETTHGNAIAIGLGAPGLPSTDRRSILSMPGRFPGLEGLDWGVELKRKKPIYVLNDAQAALRGEQWIGAAAGADHAIMLTLGTGVGGAAWIDGKLIEGRLGRAGHFGHICLNLHGRPGILGLPGTLEEHFSDVAIRNLSEGKFSTMLELLESANDGDPQSACWWKESVRALACGLASLIHAFDPEVIVLGGGIANAGEPLFHTLTDYLKEVEWKPTGIGVEIRPARLGLWAGAIGAARNALDRTSL